MKPDLIGWVATATFTSSYFVRNPLWIRGVQAIAASLWLAYGVIIGKPPVIVANVLVVAAALFTMYRERRGAA